MSLVRSTRTRFRQINVFRKEGMISLANKQESCFSGPMRHFFTVKAVCRFPSLFARIHELNAPLHRSSDSTPLHGERQLPKNDEDIDRIVKELRSALEEHVRLAKESLESQAISLALLDLAKTQA